MSTGTNNAFPLLAEATVAGAAAGHVARGVGRGAFKEDSVMHRALVVRVRPDGASEPDDLALIDALAVDDPFLGSFELFDPVNLRLAVLSRAEPSAADSTGTGGRRTGLPVGGTRWSVGGGRAGGDGPGGR